MLINYLNLQNSPQWPECYGRWSSWMDNWIYIPRSWLSKTTLVIVCSFLFGFVGAMSSLLVLNDPIKSI